MVTATLKSDLLRGELFWIALALLFAGPFVPKTISIGTVEFVISIGSLELGTVVYGLGVLLIASQIVASIIVILWSAYEGWRYGYAEGQINGRA